MPGKSPRKRLVRKALRPNLVVINTSPHEDHVGFKKARFPGYDLGFDFSLFHGATSPRHGRAQHLLLARLPVFFARTVL